MIFFKIKLPIIIVIVVIICTSLIFAYNQLYSVQMLDEQHDNISRLKQYENRDIIRVYKALNTVTGNEEVLQIVKVKGYKGTITMMANVDIASDEITNLKILSQNETESYGGYISEEWFLDRFNSKKADKHLKTVKIIAEGPDEIVAVTGATISSEAVVKGVNLLLENYMKMDK